MTAIHLGPIAEVVERASSEPEFLARLRQDPIATLRGEGYDVRTEELRQWLDMPAASEQELVEALKSRTNFDMKVTLSFQGGAG